MKKEEKYKKFSFEEFKKRIYIIQYRILKQKRRGLFLSRVLFISFYLFSYMETFEVINNIPGYSGQLFPIIKSTMNSIRLVFRLKTIADYLNTDETRVILIIQLIILFISLLVTVLLVICFKFGNKKPKNLQKIPFRLLAAYFTISFWFLYNPMIKVCI